MDIFPELRVLKFLFEEEIEEGEVLPRTEEEDIFEIEQRIIKISF